MTHLITAVLFDLGDTLMYPIAPWPPVFDQAGKALGQFLCASGVEVDCSSFPGQFLERLDQYYAERERSLLETTCFTILQELLDEINQSGIHETILRAALDNFYAITQTNWALEEDAIPTLAMLQTSGYNIGLVSNASHNRDVFQLVDKFGIEPYFDFILTSAACGYRKPHPRIYELALAHWGYMPDQVAMVGDRLNADIAGSKILGMYAIWVTRRAKEQPPASHSPDAVIQTLSEIPPLLLNLLNF